jgi:hypothetical protein
MPQMGSIAIRLLNLDFALLFFDWLRNYTGLNGKGPISR